MRNPLNHFSEHSGIEKMNSEFFYDQERRVLEVPFRMDFFSSLGTALRVLAEMGFYGLSPARIFLTYELGKGVGRETSQKTDAYAELFEPDIYQNYDLWQGIPSWPTGRHAAGNIFDWTPFIKRWFKPGEAVAKKIAEFKELHALDPQKTIGIYYSGAAGLEAKSRSNSARFSKLLKKLIADRKDHKILIFSDENRFFQEISKVFPGKCLSIVGTGAGVGANGDNHSHPQIQENDLLEEAKRSLAAAALVSDCSVLVNSTGDTAAWITLIRGHTRGMYQIGGGRSFCDPEGRTVLLDFSDRARLLAGRVSRKLGFSDKNPWMAPKRDSELIPASPSWKQGKLPRTRPEDFIGRFRDIIADPINLLIERVPEAGFTDGEFVTLHNGIKVPFSGPQAYYKEFSSIFILNRGVHEPLEEFVFQEMLKKLPVCATMIELGAYWGHYSMWLKKAKPQSRVTLVEPDANNLEAGKVNFKNNRLEGSFICEKVGNGAFSVDAFVQKNQLGRIDILHSDIQGYELEMLDGAIGVFSQRQVDYVFISTHSENLHEAVLDKLKQFGYRVEVSSAYDRETTSFDGLVFATNPDLGPVFPEMPAMGRINIIESNRDQKLNYLNAIAQGISK